VRAAALTFDVSWSGVVNCFSETNQIDGNRYRGRYAQISTATIDWSASEADFRLPPRLVPRCPPSPRWVRSVTVSSPADCAVTPVTKEAVTGQPGTCEFGMEKATTRAHGQ
jgi:hypothetical protein